MTLLRIALLLLCIGVLLPACGKEPVDIDARLADLEARREAFEARVAKVEDASLRDELDKMGAMLFWMREAEIESGREPEKTAYIQAPLAVLDDYGDMDAMARNFANGIVATHEAEHLPEHTRLVFPFAYPFGQSVRLRTATLADGTRLPVTDDFDKAAIYRALGTGADGKADELLEEDETGIVFQGSSGLTTYLRENEEPRPPPVQRLEGELELFVPGRIHRVAFKPNDVGKTREAGGFSIRLESLDGHRATVSLSPVGQSGAMDIEQLNEQLDDKVILTARDETGQTLDDSGSSSGPPGGPEEMLKILDALVTEVKEEGPIDAETLEARIKARQVELQQTHGAALFHGKTFRGRIAELDVILLDPAEGEVRKQPLVLEPMHFDVPDNTAELVPFHVAATVYDHSLETLDGGIPDEIDPAALGNAIMAARERLELADGAPDRVEFTYPEVFSNRFLSDFDRYDNALDVTFFDVDGKPIAVPEDREARESLYRFNVNRLEYHPEKFTQPPVRVTGHLEVNLMPEPGRQWVEAGSLPEGTELIGNAYFTAHAYDNRQPQVFAQDRSGRYLRKLAEVRYAYHGGVEPRIGHYFYGRPVRILLLERGPVESVEYPFDVDLAGE